MKRPVAIIVLGVVNLLWALLGLFGLIFSIVMLKQPNNPFTALMENSSAANVWMKITIPLGFIMCLVLLASGAGLLLLKPWARQLTIVYAAIEIVSGVIGLAFHLAVMAPGLIQQLPMADSPQAAGGIMGGVMGGTFGGLMNVAYSILLIVFMKRPNVQAALAGEPPGFRGKAAAH